VKVNIARLLFGTAFGLAGVLSAQAAEQVQSASSKPGGDVLEEIVVTATKTGAQSLQRTPLAISAFSANQIEERQVTNVKDLVQYTPNLQVAQSTASAEIFIRGIGSTNVFAGSDPDVTVQVDGVYLARPSSQFADLLDVERVEVLRGPQGTLYGRNAAGGTINVISRQPKSGQIAKPCSAPLVTRTIGHGASVVVAPRLSTRIARPVQSTSCK